ncbi:MAG: hypothetical protein M0Z43_09780 [Acidithiobacillus sp.]|nr:hypothetical protein [Acidithiobacillus sp.]
MALVVETGAIVANANSYISIADADAYHSDNGNTAWTGTDAVKTAAIIKAARYLNGKYRARWLGFRVRPVGSETVIAQTMEWPRLYVEVFGAAPGIVPGRLYANYLPADQIPQRVKDAQCELALRALSADLAIDADASIRRKKVDVIEKEYAPGAVPGQLVYQVVDQLLSDYLEPLGTGSVQRA